MGLRGEVDHQVHTLHQLIDRWVTDVDLGETDARVDPSGEQPVIARVGEFVDDHHLGGGQVRVTSVEKVVQKMGSDETGATGDHDSHETSTPVSPSPFLLQFS